MGNFPAKLGNLVLRLFCKRQESPTVDLPAEAGPAGPKVVVLLVPGAFLGPSDYAVLRQSLVAANCCVVTCCPSWKQLDVANFMSSASRLVEKAMEEGLVVMERASSAIPRRLLEKTRFGPIGRYSRLIVALHSLSGVVGCNSIPLRKAAGTVLLASGFLRAVGIASAMREFPFPLLSIFGELDGQHHLGKVAIDLSNSGLIFGDTNNSSMRSFAMVERCNHASFSNGNRNARRGDLSLHGLDRVDASESMSRVAGLVITFAEAHILYTSIPRSDTRLEAFERLRKETLRASKLLIPFLVALGRCPERCLRSAGGEEEVLDRLWNYATGGEMVPGDAPENILLPRHPGELAEAERFACQLQEYALGEPRSSRSVVIKATVHTVFDTFLRSKVYQYEDAIHTVLNVQCFLFSGRGQEYSHVSPMYALKLKSADGIGLPAAENSNVFIETEIGPAKAFDMAWKRAKQLCPPELLERFARRGRPLRVKERYHCVPPLWARSRSRLDGDVLTLNGWGGAASKSENESDPISISGVFYLQVPSPAWCLEHMMVHGMRG